MLFQSISFAVFFALLLSLLAVVRHHRLRIALLILGGWVFYGWWDVRFLPLLWGYTVVGWIAGLALGSPRLERHRRQIFWCAIAACLLVLGYFKYTNFFAQTISGLIGAPPPRFSIILPIGISFITFEIISYVCDVYDRKLRPCHDLMEFALFNGFFPRLISGPIIRPAQFLPQMNYAPVLRRSGLLVGGQLVLIGMFQKTVLADNLSMFVDRVYQDPLFFTSGTLWLAILSYSGQIFFDFSGYSLMAIGLARMMGFRLPKNFDYPYISRSVTEFWRRWHISLSLWLRDYLYIRLGGNRLGRFRTYANLMVTMLLGGLWHGAGWNFMLWGGLHGGALAAERAWRNTHPGRGKPSPLMAVVTWAATFLFVTLAWIPFRSPSTTTTGAVFKGLFAGGDVAWYPPQVVIVLAISVLLHLPFMRRLRGRLFLPRAHLRPVPVFVLTILAWCIILFQRTDASPFIYFQF
jgi:alginate O-acetyltransferase complex protein AlgI